METKPMDGHRGTHISTGLANGMALLECWPAIDLAWCNGMCSCTFSTGAFPSVRTAL